MTTVREFVRQSYRLINPSNPTQPLQGDDLELGILLLNQLLQYYAHTVSVGVPIGIKYVICGDSSYTPASDEVLIPSGRLANVTASWVQLSGVTYPLIQQSRNEFLASFKYEPLQGLPRFMITYPETDYVRIQIYPAPSQFFEFFLRGKFQLGTLTSNDTMDSLPMYYQRFFLFACAKDFALYKGRAEAWTQKLEEELIKAQKTMESASEVNLSITGDRASLLNGAWRVRAGI
jgi:hypothetical protein